MGSIPRIHTAGRKTPLRLQAEDKKEQGIGETRGIRFPDKAFLS